MEDDALLDPGLYEVRFLNDTVEQIEIKGAMYDMNGVIVYLIGAFDHIYNWNTIISIKKQGG